MTTQTTNRLKRSEVPEELTWDLSALFPSHEAWEKELSFIQTDIEKKSLLLKENSQMQSKSYSV